MSYVLFKDYSGADVDASLILSNLQSNKHAHVFQNFPVADDSELLLLANLVGSISLDGVKTETNRLESDVVHLIEDRRAPALDPYGNEITSTTARELDFHTDEYFSELPSSIVFLSCVEQAVVGGESLVISVEELLEHIGSQTKRTLGESVFPCHAGARPLLTRNSDHFEFRYNRLETERASKLDGQPQLSKQQILALSTVEEFANARAERFYLQPGQLLVINNRRCLHGRTAFESSQKRLLKRVRVK